MLDFATVSVVEEVPGLNYILFLKKSIRQVNVHELQLNSVIMLLQRDILETQKMPCYMYPSCSCICLLNFSLLFWGNFTAELLGMNDNRHKRFTEVNVC